MKNVIVIIVDGLRADKLGCYGNKNKISPNIDKFAKDGMLFKNCYAVQNATHPCFATIYTGKHPIEHGINAHCQIGELKYKLWQEEMKEKGYHTIAIDNLKWENIDWCDRGFDEYITIGKLHQTDNYARPITDKFLSLEKKEPFFAVLHYYDTRAPYYREKEDELYKEPYDCAVRYLDRQIKRIFEEYKDAKIILTGDHGLYLGEDGLRDIHYTLKEHILHVPLILNWKNGIEYELFSQQNIKFLIDDIIKTEPYIVAVEKTNQESIAIITKDGIKNYEPVDKKS